MKLFKEPKAPSVTKTLATSSTAPSTSNAGGVLKQSNVFSGNWSPDSLGSPAASPPSPSNEKPVNKDAEMSVNNLSSLSISSDEGECSHSQK